MLYCQCTTSADRMMDLGQFVSMPEHMHKIPASYRLVAETHGNGMNCILHMDLMKIMKHL